MVRRGSLLDGREVDDLFSRFFGQPMGPAPAPSGDVPTDVFHTDDRLVIRMDLPGVDPEKVDVTVQDNVLLINGSRPFPFDAEKVRFVRRGTFYGDFTQRVVLGKGLNLERIDASYEGGVLELTIPYAEEIQPRKIAINMGSGKGALNE
jgi:HSP20 family protein